MSVGVLWGWCEWLAWEERVVVYRGVGGGLELGGVAWADAAECAVQGVDGDGAGGAELGCGLGVLQVIDPFVAGQILGLDS